MSGSTVVIGPPLSAGKVELSLSAMNQPQATQIFAPVACQRSGCELWNGEAQKCSINLIADRLAADPGKV